METSGYFFAFLLGCLALASAQNVDSDDVKCEVCKITVLEMLEAISAVDPKKMAEVGNFRMDASGNTISKKVPYVKSETYLTDLMEDNICEKMDDYAKVIHKKTRRLHVIKLMVNNQMNPIVSEVDFVQDGDLNKSLKHYCLQVLEEYDEIFMKAFMAEQLEEDLDIKICSERAKCCMEGPAQEAYNLEDESEYKEEL